MMRIWISFTALILLVVFGGCGSSNQLGTIGGETVTLREFEDVFSRNNGGWEKAAQSGLDERQAFLELFVRYKLKLQEANTRGLLQDSAIQNELSAYRASVAANYVLEKEVVGPGIKALYDRRLLENRASHILIRVSENAAPEDTLAALNKARELCARALAEDFDSLAQLFSEDPSAKTRGGDLGWFSQGRTVRPFEDAVYGLQPGQITPSPVRTRFGYHVIKVTGRRPNDGTVQISQIVKRVLQPADTSRLLKEVTDIYDRIMRGEITFENAVEQFSDEAQSRGRQGFIGSFEKTRLPEDLGTLFFTSPVKTVLPPYQSPYGFHIYRVSGRLPVPSFEESERELRESYQKQYYPSDYEQFVQGLAKEYELSFNVNLRHALILALDSTRTPSSDDWTREVKSEWLLQPLFSYAGKSFTVRQFLDYVRSDQELRATQWTAEQLESMLDQIVKSLLLEHHGSTAADRHPGFSRLMKEYENGVLIYRLDQDEIWKKIQMNDSLLQAFYDTTKDEYTFEDRVRFLEIHVPTDSAATAMYQRIVRGEDFRALAEAYTTRPGYKEKKGEWELLPVRNNGLTQRAGSMAVDSVSLPFAFEGGWSIIKTLAREPARTKTFQEALPEVTSKYQEQASKEREHKWIESLKSRYPVTINPERLSDAFKSRPSS